MGILSLFGVGGKATEEEKFWVWFQKHSNDIFHFERDREKVFDKLTTALTNVNKDLTFEFSPVRENGKREFVISAGGIKSAFSSVESLCQAAPDLEKWIVVAYRQRRSPLNDLSIGDVTVKAEDVYYHLYPDGDKLGVVLFFEHFSQDEYPLYGNLGYLFLDESLGEYDVETKLGFIEFQNTSSSHFEGARPLSSLAEQVDAFYANSSIQG